MLEKPCLDLLNYVFVIYVTVVGANGAVIVLMVGVLRHLIVTIPCVSPHDWVMVLGPDLII